MSLSRSFQKYANVFLGVTRFLPWRVHLVEQLVQVLSAELSFKRFGRRLPVVLKVKESLCQIVQVWKIVGCQDFPLDDGEVDLYLVQPTGMDRCVNQDHVWVLVLQALHSSGAAVSRTVVDNP